MTSDKGLPLLGEIEAAIAAAARMRGPAVIGIGRRSGRGSGIVTAPNEVLTLASNLRDPSGQVGVDFTGRGEATATGEVAGIDGALDLALIRVPTGEIEPLAFAQQPAGLGAAVIALANPGGQGLRATLGFVAATERRFRGPRGRVVGGALEHTAAMARGSGGGPLLDLEGRVVGLNAVRVAGGLILTLPGAQVAERAGILRDADADADADAGAGATPVLGVAIVSPRVARRLRRAVGLPERDGLLVHEVAAGSPADRAEIRTGDLIVAAADAPVDGVDALYAALDRAAAAGTIALQIVRGVDEHEVAVSLDGGRA